MAAARLPARRRGESRRIGPGRSRPSASLLVLGLAGAFTACAGTGPSRGPQVSFGPDTDRQPITFRQLSRRDFGADRPPARMLAHASTLGAVICASIRVTPDSRFHTQRVRRTDGSLVWVAVIDRLRFRAEMQSDCSWWNPEVPGHDAARILQHEQVHFSLFEIAARHLNQRIFSLVTVFRFTASSRARAEAAAIAYVRELEDMAVDELRARNQEYDRDTSYGSRTYRQRDWHADIQRELLETARYAAVSDEPWPPLDGSRDGGSQEAGPRFDGP